MKRSYMEQMSMIYIKICILIGTTILPRNEKTGRFDKELAIKGLAQNYVPMIIMKYNKTFGRGSITLNAAEKVEVAKHFYDRLFRDFGLKNIRKGQNFVKRHR